MMMCRELTDDEIIKVASDNWVLEVPADAITLVRACFEAARVEQNRTPHNQD